jgi:hypothetical protein
MQNRMLVCAVCLVSLAGCSTKEIPWVPTDTGGNGSGGASAGGGSGGSPAAATGGLPDMGGSPSEGLGGAGSGFYEIVAVSDAGDIVGLGVNDEHVFWLTYGTRNTVTGKYKLDGALHRRAIEGGETETILEGLEGPFRLEVTTDEVFVWLGKTSTGTKHEGIGIGRVSVDGGELQLVGGPETVGTGYNYFDAVEDHAYLFLNPSGEAEQGVYEYVAGEPPRQVLQSTGDDLAHIAADASYLYFAATAASYRMPLEGSTPELLPWVGVGFDIGPDGQVLWAFSVDDEWHVLSLPAAGDQWESVATLPSPPQFGHYGNILVVGERWFSSLSTQSVPSGHQYTIYTGDVDGGDVEPLPNVLSESDVWRANEENVFRASGDALVRIPLE